MRTALYTVALGAALLLTASTRIGSSGGPGLHSRYQVHVRGYQARRGTHSGLLPGAHERPLRRLLDQVCRRRIWSSQQCKGDIQHFCPHATYGNISDCMRPHLGEASDQCRGAIAFIASPAGD